ncbi:hypothetical protein LTR08_002631 [Meristemomyces frigidus]|nr:hypothetical protein LTR08_002631 [Meristemomyces frigidus]
MSAAGKQFIGLLPPTERRPRTAFYGPAVLHNFGRDNFTITTWLCMGAAVQGLLFLAVGRLALLPAVSVLLYRTFIAYAMTQGWMHNTCMDGVLMKKTSAQFPDANGKYGTKPADSEIVVFLIGTRCNHPMGLLAPGYKDHYKNHIVSRYGFSFAHLHDGADV